MKLFNAIRGLLSKAGYAETQDMTEAIMAMTNEIVELRGKNVEIPALKLKAADGETYRKHLVEDAIKAGVRAHGDKFDKAEYQKVLEVASLDTIKRMTADWTDVGDKLFPGGRSTTDGNEGEEGQTSSRRVPVGVYAS